MVSRAEGKEIILSLAGEVILKKSEIRRIPFPFMFFLFKKVPGLRCDGQS